jgi:hypothetical protein
MVGKSTMVPFLGDARIGTTDSHAGRFRAAFLGEPVAVQWSSLGHVRRRHSDSVADPEVT